MNKNQIQSKILTVLHEKRKGVFLPNQPGRFMTILVHDIGVGNKCGTSRHVLQTVITALESLETQGEIAIRRRGNKIIGIVDPAMSI